MLLENTTPFEAGTYAVADRDGGDLLLVIVRATYTYDARGSVEVASEQAPVELADQYNGEPGTSSLRSASDFSIGKPATDVSVTGHAYPPRSGAAVADVGVRVGAVQRVLRVFGERFWHRTTGVPRISSPAPFERMPLVYERAFGGADTSPADPRHHEAEDRNPVGVGFRAKRDERPAADVPLPNLEDPMALISSPSDRPAPTALGPVPPAWEPRRRFAGTYDDVWRSTRCPLLPFDFDARFFNAAAPGLVASGFLRGDEPVAMTGLSPAGHVRFTLPGVRPRGVAVSRSDGERQLPLPLGTVAIDADAGCLTLVWSGSLSVPRGFRDIEAVRCEFVSQRT